VGNNETSPGNDGRSPRDVAENDDDEMLLENTSARPPFPVQIHFPLGSISKETVDEELE
jgi:hypothetical protein